MKYLYAFFLTTFFISSLPLMAQQDSLIREEIDRQIWYPFIEAYNDYNAEAFNAIHAPDVMRATPWGIRTGEEYFERNKKGFKNGKEAGNTRAISFTFEYRVHKPDKAYEVGYYRVIENKDGEEKIHVGQFHVVLKKTDGKWKIAQDWDSGALNGREITVEDFMKNAGKGVYE